MSGSIICKDLSHSQDFHILSVDIKDDILDVSYCNLISIKLHVHLPLAVLKRKKKMGSIYKTFFYETNICATVQLQ